MHSFDESRNVFEECCVMDIMDIFFPQTLTSLSLSPTKESMHAQLVSPSVSSSSVASVFKRRCLESTRRKIGSSRPCCRAKKKDDDDENVTANNNSQQRRRRRTALLGVASTSMFLKHYGDTNPALAIQSEIELTNLSYTPTECPPNQYLPSKKSAMCVLFTATAKSKKKVSAANVFGFIDDYDGNSAATNNETGTSRVVLAQIDEEIPEGTSEVTFVVTVFKESYNKGKFKLKGFKAVEANAAINKRFVPLGDCDLDTSAPGCPDDPLA